MSALALADREIPATNRFKMGPAVVSSTLDVFPQIQPPGRTTRRIEEDDGPAFVATDPLNSLKAGGLMAGSRGTPQVSFPGPGFTGFVPPDCDMGVGPKHVVAVVNLSIAFYKKDGTLTFQQNMDQNGFWAGVGGNSQIYSDPKVFYDAAAQRWFVFMIEINGLGSGTHISHVLTAVSKSSDPNGTWYKYALNSLITNNSNDYWSDYPTVGMNKDGIAIGGNMFGFTSGGGFSGLFVVPKAPLLTGAAATVTTFQDSADTIQPARSWDTTQAKLYCTSRGNGSTIHVYAISNAGGVPTLVQTDVAVPSYSSPVDAPSAGGNFLDTIRGRLFNCWYRNGNMVMAHTITTSGSQTNRVRWYQIAVNNWPTAGKPTLLQSGDINPSPNVHTHMPAICQNANGDISVVYTRSSTTIAADLMMSSRVSSDPLGVMGSPVKLKTSSGTYGDFRWGDFFSCVVDPVDNTTFWGYGMEISNANVWQTSVHSWTTGGGISGTVIAADSVDTALGNYIFGDLTSIQKVDGLTYQIGSVLVPQLGQAAATDVTFTVPTTTQQLSVNFDLYAGITGGTTGVWLFDWSANQLVLVGSAPMPASGTATKTISIRASDVARYIGPGGQVHAYVRGLLPIKPFHNNNPNPFTYQLDMIQLVVQ